MGKINLLRVDGRLIHGQVMTKWSKGRGTNSIYVIDDETAADEFMKDIYVTTNSSANLKIRVYSTDEIVEQWEKDHFGNDTAILLFKNISSAVKVIFNGLPASSLNIGGVAKTSDSTFVIPSVGLSKNDASLLQKLQLEKNVEVYFQTLPDTKKVSLDDAIKLLK